MQQSGVWFPAPMVGSSQPLQLQGLWWPLLGSTDTCTPMHIHKETLTYTYRKLWVFRLGMLIPLKLVCQQENLYSNATPSAPFYSLLSYKRAKALEPHLACILKILTFLGEKNEIFPLLCWWNWLLMSKYKTGIQTSHNLIKIICNFVSFKHIRSSYVLSGKLTYFGQYRNFLMWLD